MKKLLLLLLIASSLQAGKKSAAIGYWGIKTVGYGTVIAGTVATATLCVATTPVAPIAAAVGAGGVPFTAPVSVGGAIGISTKVIAAIEGAALVTKAALERCPYLP